MRAVTGLITAIALVAGCAAQPETVFRYTSPPATPAATFSVPTPSAPSPVGTPPTPYANTSYKFSVALPQPYRKSARLSLGDTGAQRPAAQDAFTARTEADEATLVGTNCQTACPIWNYVAVVMVNTGAGTQTPQQWYASSGGAVGETIEDTTVDGRQAIKVTNGATYPLQYLVKDGDRMIRIAYAIYSDMPVPTGATKEKLDLLITSLRFTP